MWAICIQAYRCTPTQTQPSVVQQKCIMFIFTTGLIKCSNAGNQNWDEIQVKLTKNRNNNHWIKPWRWSQLKKKRLYRVLDYINVIIFQAKTIISRNILKSFITHVYFGFFLYFIWLNVIKQCKKQPGCRSVTCHEVELWWEEKLLSEMFLLQH